MFKSLGQVKEDDHGFCKGVSYMPIELFIAAVVTAIILVGGVSVKVGDINIGNGRRDNEDK